MGTAELILKTIICTPKIYNHKGSSGVWSTFVGPILDTSLVAKPRRLVVKPPWSSRKPAQPTIRNSISEIIYGIFFSSAEPPHRHSHWRMSRQFHDHQKRTAHFFIFHPGTSKETCIAWSTWCAGVTQKRPGWSTGVLPKVRAAQLQMSSSLGSRKNMTLGCVKEEYNLGL